MRAFARDWWMAIPRPAREALLGLAIAVLLSSIVVGSFAIGLD